jgi:hypothetical protein
MFYYNKVNLKRTLLHDVLHVIIVLKLFLNINILWKVTSKEIYILAITYSHIFEYIASVIIQQFYCFRANMIAKKWSVFTLFIVILQMNLIILNNDLFIVVVFEYPIEMYFHNYYLFMENILLYILLKNVFTNVWKHAFNDELYK